MDKSKYLVDGEIGKPAVVGKFGTQFEMTNRIPLVKNTVFETYAKAYTYITTNDTTTMPGIIITVTDDPDEAKRGAYVTDHDTATESNPNGLKLVKLAESETGPGNLGWGEIIDNGDGGIIITPPKTDLTIHNQYVEIQ